MKFSETHEWVEESSGTATVGVTDHAQKELGDIVYVELPKVGKEVKAGEEAVVLESTKAAADVYSPVSGKVIEVNSVLSSSPDLVNKHAESQGWLFKIELKDPKELDNLLDQKQYLSKL